MFSFCFSLLYFVLFCFGETHATKNVKGKPADHTHGCFPSRRVPRPCRVSCGPVPVTWTETLPGRERRHREGELQTGVRGVKAFGTSGNLAETGTACKPEPLPAPRCRDPNLFTRRTLSRAAGSRRPPASEGNNSRPAGCFTRKSEDWDIGCCFGQLVRETKQPAPPKWPTVVVLLPASKVSTHH